MARLAQGGPAAAAAPAAVARSVHTVTAHRAVRHPGGVQALPYAIEPLLEREPAAVGAVGPLTAEPLWVEDFAPRPLRDQRQLPCAPARRRNRAHDTLLHTPTTFPSTATSRVRMGSMVGFSGCSLMWSDSRK